MKRYLLFVLGLTSMMASNVQAAFINTEVNSNAYITIGGYDVAWVGPCAQASPSCGAIDYSVQSQFGWAPISRDLFNSLGITANSFVFSGANVDYITGNNFDELSGATVAYVIGNAPLNDVAVATPWFSNSYRHIDWDNGHVNLWSFADANGESYWESVAYRIHDGADIPEPTSFALLAAGIMSFGFARRKATQA